MVIELTSEDQARLTQMADAMQRSEVDLAREAMHWLLAPHEEHRAVIASSRREVEEGKTIDHEAVFTEINRLLSN